MLNKDLPDDTQFCIMKTDWCEPEQVYKPRMNCSDWEGWGGANEADGYPATRPYKDDADCYSKIPATRWPKEWVEYYLYLNREYLWEAFDIANGIVNAVNGQVQIEPPYNLDQYEQMPKFENLSFVGSIHIAEEKRDKGVRIRTWNYSDPPNHELNFRNSVMVSKFTGIMKDTGMLINLYHTAADCYLPLCVRDGREAWIDSVEVEYFPELGFVAIGDRAIVTRTEPGAEHDIVDILYKGEHVYVDRYHPSGYDVWGRTQFGWIPLRYQIRSGAQAYVEPTSWRLETKPGCKPWLHSIDGELGYISPYADDIPQEDEVLYQVKVIVPGLNVRTGPSIEYAKVRVVLEGDILNVYEEKNNWIRIGQGEWCSGYPAYIEKIESPPGDYDQGWNDALDKVLDAIKELR